MKTQPNFPCLVGQDIEQRQWLKSLIESSVPGWRDKPFDYDGRYGIWRASYKGELRNLIRNFEHLTSRLQMPPGLEMVIANSCICIRETGGEYHESCAYETLRKSVPMASPLEPEKLWRMVLDRPDTPFLACSFGHWLKSHVVRSPDRAGMLKLEAFFDRTLCHQGYHSMMFWKPSTPGNEYLLALTHETELQKPLIDTLAIHGFLPGHETGIRDPFGLDSDFEPDQAFL